MIMKIAVDCDKIMIFGAILVGMLMFQYGIGFHPLWKVFSEDTGRIPLL